MKENNETLLDFGSDIDAKTLETYNHYIDMRKKIQADSQTSFDPFIKVYGPKGKLSIRADKDMSEYNNTNIDIPEGMTEEMVTAIILGFAMDPEGISKYIPNNDVQGISQLENYQMHMIDGGNILSGDHRDAHLIPHLIESRKKAKAAIDAYAKDKTKDGPIKQALQNLADFSVKGVHAMESSKGPATETGISPEKWAYSFCQHIMENSPFYIKPNVENITELNTIRVASYSKQIESISVGESFKLAMINNFDNMSQSELEKYTEEMLFNEYIASMATIQRNARNNMASDFIKNFFSKLGVDTDVPTNERNEWGSIIEDSTVSYLDNTMHSIYANYSISDFDVILAQPGGKEKLRDLYSKEIRKSEAFKKIVNSSDKAELMNNIMASDREVAKGITSINTVTLPNAAESLNKKYAPKLRSELDRASKQLTSVSYQSEEIFQDTVDEFSFNSIDHNGLVEMSKKINQLYKDMKSNNIWGGSKNNYYKNAMNKLAELNKFLFEAAKSGKPLSYSQSIQYDNLIDQFTALSDKYLNNKTDINSTYAKNRVLIMGKAKRCLTANKFSVKEKQTEIISNKAYELFDLDMTNFKKYDFKSAEFTKPFRGTKYKMRDGLSTPAGYSVFRDADLSIATMALINTGKYSMDDIMDSNKLINEKRDMHEKVMQRLMNKTDANQKWIAENIYNGLNKSMLMMDEAAKKVNFNDPKLLENETFCKMINLGHLQFDAWQEMSHCKPEIVSLAQKDHPEIKDYDNLKEMLASQIEPIAGYRENMNEKMKSAALVLLNKPSNISQLAIYDMKIHALDSLLKEYEDSGKEKPLHTFFPKDVPQKNYLLSSLGMAHMISYAKPMINRTDIGEELVEKIIKGDMKKDMKISISLTPDNVTIEGLPDIQEFIQSAETSAFLKKTDEAMARLENPSTKYKNEKQYLDDASYAIIGQIYRLSKKLPLDPVTNKQISLETWRTKSLEADVFKNSLKKSDGEYMTPKKVAAYAKNEKKIRQTIEINNKRTMEKAKEHQLHQQNPVVPNPAVQAPKKPAPAKPKQQGKAPGPA